MSKDKKKYLKYLEENAKIVAKMPKWARLGARGISYKDYDKYD